MILDKGEPVQITDDPEAPPPAYEEHAEHSSNAFSSHAIPQRGASYPNEKRREVVYTYTPGRDDQDPQTPFFPTSRTQPGGPPVTPNPPGYVYAQTPGASHASPPSRTLAPSWPADTSDYPSGSRSSQFANNPCPPSTRGSLSRGESFDKRHSRGHSYGGTSSSPLLPPSTPSELLNPPPPSFSRPPQSGLPYGPFPLLAHFSQGTGIDGGFAATPPPTHIDPHPFATHDVNEEDWARFLDDIRRAGSLSPLNKFTVGAVPFAVGIGIIGGGTLRSETCLVLVADDIRHRDHSSQGHIRSHEDQETCLCRRDRRPLEQCVYSTDILSSIS